MIQKLQTMQALKTIDGGAAAVQHDAPLPEPKDNQIMAETKALAVNPTDWDHMKYLTEPGSTLGCDFSGVVLKVGKNVTRFQVGDEVWGACHGGHNTNMDSGAFGQFVVCNENASCHKPANISWEDAATLGVGTMTCGQVMYYTAGLPTPAKENLSKKPTKDVLIYGGSTSTGTLAIQLAKLSGYRVLATSSVANHALLLSRGADLVFDYKSPTAVAEIQSAVGDNLSYICDCVGVDSSAEFCAPLLSSQGGHYHSVRFPGPQRLKELRPEEGIKSTSSLGYTLLGTPFELKGGIKFGVHQEEYDFAMGWAPVVDALLADGLIKAHPVEVREGQGLEGVCQGLDDVETGKLSGKKLVFPMQW